MATSTTSSAARRERDLLGQTVLVIGGSSGIGLETVEAIDQRDWPLLQAIFLLLACSVIFFNLVADLLYVRLDPRVVEA